MNPAPDIAGAYLFSRSAAMALRDEEGAVVVKGPFAQVRAEGVIADKLWRSFSGQGTAAWAQLAGDGPLGRILEALASETPVPVSPTEALRLGRFDTLFIELIGRCNERCSHCYADSTPQVSEALTESEVCQILRDAAALGFERVQFTGGEPLLCPFVADVIAYARELGLPRVEIFSNGTLLDETMLERLLPSRPELAFSVYSADAITHDAITHLPGSHRRTVAAIRRCLAAGLSVRVAVVWMQGNIADGERTIEWLRDLGVARVDGSATLAVGRGTYLAATPSKLVSIGQSTHRGDAPRHGGGALCVTWAGHVVPCIFNRDDRLGSIRERSLAEIVREPELGSLADPSQEVGERLACAGCRLTHMALRHAAGASR